MGPLGSFIQLAAGSRWNCGRSGSLASRASLATSVGTSLGTSCGAEIFRVADHARASTFGTTDQAAAPAPMAVRKFRRAIFMGIMPATVHKRLPSVLSGVAGRQGIYLVKGDTLYL